MIFPTSQVKVRLYTALERASRAYAACSRFRGLRSCKHSMRRGGGYRRPLPMPLPFGLILNTRETMTTLSFLLGVHVGVPGEDTRPHQRKGGIRTRGLIPRGGSLRSSLIPSPSSCVTLANSLCLSEPPSPVLPALLRRPAEQTREGAMMGVGAALEHLYPSPHLLRHRLGLTSSPLAMIFLCVRASRSVGPSTPRSCQGRGAMVRVLSPLPSCSAFALCSPCSPWSDT